MAGVLIGEGVISINGTTLQGMHDDSSYINLEADGEVANLTLRMRMASTGEIFLQKLLDKQLKHECSWLQGQYIRSVMESSGLKSKSTLLDCGLFTCKRCFSVHSFLTINRHC
ncbi:MAG: hypothetical protein JJW01_02380 [Alphaproteobacteria bacterium]|nr:hypothetical protein [Rickettsiales bacterium]